jgi:hypothetical protein
VRYFGNFADAIARARGDLLNFGDNVDTGRWQGVPTAGKPDLITREVTSWGMSVPVRWHGSQEETLDYLRDSIEPNLPWADDHFAERVSRNPTNPGEEYYNWPWWHNQAGAFAAEDSRIFTHTYQERFWPRWAGDSAHFRDNEMVPMKGLRYNYGDLDDLVNLLHRDPYTRQAYLPIFFPEDTGAVHGGRIPCTLGYQFLLRDNLLHMWYFIRSCDYVRHFRDDIYLACRLLLWVLDQLQGKEQISNEQSLVATHSDWVWSEVDPGYLNMLVCSLHYHKGDEHLVYGSSHD